MICFFRLPKDCDEPRANNVKFCKEHKRSWDAMSYQAAKSTDPEAEATWNELNESDAALSEAVTNFAQELSKKHTSHIHTPGLNKDISSFGPHTCVLRVVSSASEQHLPATNMYVVLDPVICFIHRRTRQPPNTSGRA
jgi:hypothetical protein